jgi:flotillin
MSRAQRIPGSMSPQATTQIHVTDRAKESEGWRQGRPVEDPEKTKRWGFVSAKPSEFLVHVRRGAVRSSSSGQGATCFKLPWDSVAVIPTSLQQLRFRADQVTLEKVGIEVVGLAVYRIAEPLIAYRVLNFSFPERAQEKLEETLTSMFVGAARRLIANLTLDDCLQKRKSALAEELLREVAPVVGGDGRLDDSTEQGWGLVIDTIEIQEVRVLSDAVFSQMQAPYRASLDRRAREARAEAEKEITAREAACNRAIEEARIQAALVVAERKKELAQQELEIRREESMRKALVERELAELKLVEQAALELRKADIELQAHEAETKKELRLQALRREEAEAELAAWTVLAEAAQKRAELERLTLAVEIERRRAHAGIDRLEGEGRAAIAQAQALVRSTVAEADARVKLAERLPELAQAVGARIGEVKVTHIGGDGAGAFSAVTGAVQSIVELVKSA